MNMIFRFFFKAIHLFLFLLLFHLGKDTVVYAQGHPDMPANGNVRPEQNVREYDLIPFRQINGTTLHIRGLRVDGLEYTETRDGYTIVLNSDGVYEYARQTREGDLEPGGQLANDPGEREPSEIRYLNRKEKHLRYKSPTKDEMLENRRIRFAPFEKK